MSTRAANGIAGVLGVLRQGAVTILSVPIHLYRYLISPMLLPSCRFEPSCSCYALEALQAHGPVEGTFLAVKRLSRCHPVTAFGGGSGYDPVPMKRRQA
jgi:uncharacterized protein